MFFSHKTTRKHPYFKTNHQLIKIFKTSFLQYDITVIIICVIPTLDLFSSIFNIILKVPKKTLILRGDKCIVSNIVLYKNLFFANLIKISRNMNIGGILIVFVPTNVFVYIKNSITNWNAIKFIPKMRLLSIEFPKLRLKKQTKFEIFLTHSF